jgi:hypothetical protein
LVQADGQVQFTVLFLHWHLSFSVKGLQSFFSRMMEEWRKAFIIGSLPFLVYSLVIMFAVNG